MNSTKTAAFAAALLLAGSALAAQPAPKAGAKPAPAPAAAPAPAPAAPGPDMSKVEIKTTDLGNKTYELEGNGGNITVAVGDDAIIMVDTEFAPLHDKIKAAIAKFSPLPIKYVVNTHYHGDHSGGNELFQKEGATVVADVQVGERMKSGVTNALTGAKTPPAPKDAIPKQTYSTAITLTVKGRRALVLHEINAHTDGDSAVFFPEANVLAAGDIVSTGNRYPNIDIAVGGNIKGIVAACDNYLAMSNDQTKIVPGHGALMNKAQLKDYRDMMAAARDRVAKLMSEGKSEDDVVAAKPIQDIEAKAGANEMATANFLRLIYRSLKA